MSKMKSSNKSATNTKELLDMIHRMADLLDEVSPVHMNGIDFHKNAIMAIENANKLLKKNGHAEFVSPADNLNSRFIDWSKENV
jgi:hypothetical protein